MRKGKFGINLYFYAVLGFILAFLGQTMLCAILVGFVLIVEEDEWTAKQGIQALTLSAMGSALTVVVSMIRSLNSILFASTGIYSVFSKTVSFLDLAIDIVIFVFALIAITNVKKGNEASVPFASKFSDWAYGKVTEKPVYQQPNMQQPYQQPNMQQQYQQPNMQQPYQQPNMQQPYQQPNMQQPNMQQSQQNDVQ